MRLDARADRVHHLEIDAEQIVAAHARLARHAGGDDDDVGAGDRRVVARARELGVEALDRAGFGEIERLALRNAVDDVEQDDVAQLLHRREMSQRAADLSGSDQCDLLARHGLPPARLRCRSGFASKRLITQKDGVPILPQPRAGKSNFCRSAEKIATIDRVALSK